MGEDAQECKDCNGKGYFDRNHLGKTPTSCQTCEGDGHKYRTGPYRLADGTWSDEVDRSERISSRYFESANTDRMSVFYEDVWVAMSGEMMHEAFPTHAEAIAYAARMARTNQGENK